MTAELHPRSWERLFMNDGTFTIYVVFTHRVGGNHFEHAYAYVHDAEERVKQFTDRGFIAWFMPVAGDPTTNRPRIPTDGGWKKLGEANRG